MAFTVNRSDVMSNFDTTYANENIVNVTGFKVNGTDIGNTATPGVSGYTSDNAVEDDAFKTSNVSFNELFSTSKPLVIVHNIYSGGKWTNRTYGDYIFRENKAYTDWRNMIRLTIPNIPGVEIPLRILLVGGGGGGGSSAHTAWEGAAGGGAGTYLDLTMTLNETHDQHYFYGICANGGRGGGYGDNSNERGEAGEMGGDTQLRFQNTSGQAINQYVAKGGAGGGGNRDSTQARGDNNKPNDPRGSGGGATGYGQDNKPGGTAGDPSYLETIWRADEHPTTSIDARANQGGAGRRYGNPGGGGGGAGSGGATGNATHNTGGNGGNGLTWINGQRYAGGGAGENSAYHSQHGGQVGGGDYASGAGVTTRRDATNGTGSGGMGWFDWWYERTHGGYGGEGFIGIGIPRIFTDANHHTFTPL